MKKLTPSANNSPAPLTASKPNTTKPSRQLNHRTTHLTKRIDSLQHLNPSTTKYTKSLDSLNHQRLTITSKLQSRLDSLKSKTIGKLSALELPSEYKKPLEDLTKNIDKLNLNSDMVKIPKLEIPGYSLADINVPQDLTSKASQPTDLGNPGHLPKLPGVETPAGDLGKISQQAQA